MLWKVVKREVTSLLLFQKFRKTKHKNCFIVSLAAILAIIKYQIP